MEINSTKTVRELTIEIPGATRVFEKLGIDYCCSGGKSFQQACDDAGVSTDEVAQTLGKAGQPDSQDERSIEWQFKPLSELTSYIVAKHHDFTRNELSRLNALLSKVCWAHGQNHPELLRLQRLFKELTYDLIPHMHKEEVILFPFISQLETAASTGTRTAIPFFGTVQNPIQMMMIEHEKAGDILAQIRQVTGSFLVPEDGCLSYQTLYNALKSLEQDLHQHIHLENNILFPRAIEVEGLD